MNYDLFGNEHDGAASMEGSHEDGLPTYSTSKCSVELGRMTQDVGPTPAAGPFSPYVSCGDSFRLCFPPDS
jgi:hypothetical protein